MYGHWECFEQLVIRKEDEGEAVVDRTIIPRDQVQEWLESILSEVLKNLWNYHANVAATGEPTTQL